MGTHLSQISIHFFILVYLRDNAYLFLVGTCSMDPGMPGKCKMGFRSTDLYHWWYLTSMVMPQWLSAVVSPDSRQPGLTTLPDNLRNVTFHWRDFQSIQMLLFTSVITSVCQTIIRGLHNIAISGKTVIPVPNLLASLHTQLLPWTSLGSRYF